MRNALRRAFGVIHPLPGKTERQFDALDFAAKALRSGQEIEKAACEIYMSFAHPPPPKAVEEALNNLRDKVFP